jgi:transcriptional regulator with XRE-family HTH domain
MTRQGGWPESGFGGRLRQLREAAGLTQQQLGDRAGCHAMTVAKLEAGAQEPAWPLVLALADALAVSTEEFRAREGGAGSERPRRGRPLRRVETSAVAPATPPAEQPARKRKGRKPGGR